VAEYVHGSRRLPAAHLTPAEFRLIDTVLGAEYRTPDATVTWEFFRGKGQRTNSSEDLNEILNEVADKKGIYSFRVYAEDERTSIEIKGGPPGTQLTYDAAEDLLARTLDKVHRIKGIFRENGRAIVGKIPTVSRPKLSVGQPIWTIKVSRDEIIQAVVTRWLITILTAPVSFAFGLMLGWASNPPISI